MRLFRLSQVSRILDGLPIRVCVKVGQPNIQPDILLGWRSLFNSLDIKAKLNVVPISTTHNAHSFNSIQLVEVQVTGSPHLETSSFEPIGESDSSSILRQLPTASFVLNRTMCLMLLKSGKPFLLGFFLAVVVKPSNRRPSSFSRSLTSHRVELVCPRKFLGENFAISTQFVPSNPFIVHPVSDAKVADKTCSTNRFIKLFILMSFALKFCLKYQHFT